MKQKTHKRLTAILMAAALACLTLGGGAAAFAADVTEGADTETVKVKVEDFMTVETDDLNPETITLNGTTKSGESTTKATVKTNSSTGYNLTVKMQSNADGDLVHTVTNTLVIPTLESNGSDTDAANLSIDTGKGGVWGFNGGLVDVYKGMPGSGVTAIKIAESQGPTVEAGAETPVEFGAHINNTQASGTYTGIVLFTAMANAAT